MGFVHKKLAHLLALPPPFYLSEKEQEGQMAEAGRGRWRELETGSVPGTFMPQRFGLCSVKRVVRKASLRTWLHASKTWQGESPGHGGEEWELVTLFPHQLPSSFPGLFYSRSSTIIKHFLYFSLFCLCFPSVKYTLTKGRDFRLFPAMSLALGSGV